MLEPEHTGVEQPVLYMTEHEPGLIELRTLSAPRGPAPQRRPDFSGEPAWALAVEQLVVSAFAGRDVCFIVDQPPIEWSDVELEQLGGRMTALQSGTYEFRLVFAEIVSPAVLARAAASQDFRAGGLLIAAVPEHPAERIRDFLIALKHSGSGFPPWKEWIRLPRDEIDSLLHAQLEAKLACNEEFMECVNDGEQINWYHPQPAALGRCRAELQAWAVGHGWRFEANAAEGGSRG